jgi:hypothetical protein
MPYYDQDGNQDNMQDIIPVIITAFDCDKCGRNTVPISPLSDLPRRCPICGLEYVEKLSREQDLDCRSI